MGFSIEAADDESHLIVRATGKFTIVPMRQAIEAVRDQGHALGVCRFLFDLRQARNIESFAANHQFASHDLPAMGIVRSARAALLVDPGDRSHDFIATLSRNAGYEVRLFTDMAQALTWLRP